MKRSTCGSDVLSDIVASYTLIFPQMDSFTTVSLKPTTDIESAPPTYENGNSGGGYCVIAREQVAEGPVTFEGGGSGGAYCVVA
jgi:hypothetical protein